MRFRNADVRGLERSFVSLGVSRIPVIQRRGSGARRVGGIYAYDPMEVSTFGGLDSSRYIRSRGVPSRPRRIPQGLAQAIWGPGMPLQGAALGISTKCAEGVNEFCSGRGLTPLNVDAWMECQNSYMLMNCMGEEELPSPTPTPAPAFAPAPASSSASTDTAPDAAPRSFTAVCLGLIAGVGILVLAYSSGSKKSR